MIGRVNQAVFPGQAAGLSPEPMNTGLRVMGAELAAHFSRPTMFMDSGLAATRRPGKTG
jgi:hypothetical protein